MPSADERNKMLLLPLDTPLSLPPSRAPMPGDHSRTRPAGRSGARISNPYPIAVLLAKISLLASPTALSPARNTCKLDRSCIRKLVAKKSRSACRDASRPKAPMHRRACRDSFTHDGGTIVHVAASQLTSSKVCSKSKPMADKPPLLPSPSICAHVSVIQALARAISPCSHSQACTRGSPAA
jgi:hypothetical protein